MATLFLLIFYIFMLGSVWFFRLSFWLAIGLFGVVTIVCQYLGWIQYSALLIWPLLVGVALGCGVPKIRQRWFSKPFFNWFKKVLPAMSQTEKVAIESGDVWFEKELFQGKPNWEQLIKMQPAVLSDEEQNFLDNPVSQLCEMLDDWHVTHELCALPESVWKFIKEHKFFGMAIPKQYGGLEFSAQAHSAIIVKIATRSVSAAVTVMVPNSLGPGELIFAYGTEEQKNYYLPRLAQGKEIPCFGLTSTEAGSDAGSLIDKGIVCKAQFEGQETIGIKLTFEKRYITLAPVATLMGLAFKLFDPQKLLGDEIERGITICLLPLTTPGVEVGNRHFPLNMAFPNGPIRGKEVFVPLDWIIGGEKMIGQGWRMLIECLSAGRGISLPALSTATAVLSVKTTGAYSTVRRQFGLAIKDFEGVADVLGRMAGMTYMLDACRRFTLIPIHEHLKPAIATAIAKYHSTELARKVINDAMDIHAGRAIMMGEHNYLARAYQGTPVSITVEGANILTRNLIIFGQGAIRCHPYIKAEIEAAMSDKDDPQAALEKFDRLCFKHIGYAFSNIVRCKTYAFTQGWACSVNIESKAKPYLKKLTWLSAALAVVSDLTLLWLGGELKRKEQLSARLGDVLSYLYIASAVVKCFHEDKNEEAWPIVQWALSTCLYETQEAFYGIFENFPSQFFGWALRLMIFPYGKAFKKPADRLSLKCAQLVSQKSTTREQLTQLCYMSTHPEDSVNQMEQAFSKSLGVQALMKKIIIATKKKQLNKNLVFEQLIQAALHQKIIDESELNELQQYEKLRKSAIAVDEFTPNYPLGTEK